jgi:hypothetical protein
MLANGNLHSTIPLILFLLQLTPARQWLAVVAIVRSELKLRKLVRAAMEPIPLLTPYKMGQLDLSHR